MDFATIKIRKFHEIEYYVKKKLQTYRKSRENKRGKVEKRVREMEEKEREMQMERSGGMEVEEQLGTVEGNQG